MATSGIIQGTYSKNEYIKTGKTSMENQNRRKDEGREVNAKTR